MRGEQLRRQHGEFARWQCVGDLPAAVQRVFKIPSLTWSLIDQAPLELVAEFKVYLVGRSQRGLADQLGQLPKLPGAG